MVKIISVRFDFANMFECTECEQDFPELRPILITPFSCLLSDNRILHGSLANMGNNKKIGIAIDLSVLSESERAQGLSETDRNLIIDSYLDQHIKAVN